MNAFQTDEGRWSVSNAAGDVIAGPVGDEGKALTKAGRGRRLVDGSMVAEYRIAQPLVLDTKCPEKWVAVDLETGNVWRGSTKGWKRLAGRQHQAISASMARSE